MLPDQRFAGQLTAGRLLCELADGEGASLGSIDRNVIGRLLGNGRGSCRCATAALVHLIGHVLSHDHSHASAHHVAHGAAALANALRRLELHVVVQVAHRAHAGPLVDGLLDFRRKRDVLDQHLVKLKSVFVYGRLNLFDEEVAHLPVLASQVQDRNLGVAQNIAELGNDDVADLSNDLVLREFAVGADHVLQEQGSVLDRDRVGAKSSDAHDAEVLIAHHDRVHGAPLQVGESLGVDEVNLGNERGIEAVLPTLEGGKNRHVLRAQRVHARLEHVGDLAFIHEHSHLRFANGQLCAVLNLVAIPLEPVHHRVLGVIGPLDDVNKFALDLVPEAHIFRFLLIVALGASIQRNVTGWEGVSGPNYG